MFVSKSPVPITLDHINTIFIKPRLNYGEKMRVQKAAIKIKSKGTATDFETDFDSSGYQYQLLIESVVSWSGPVFEGRPCTPENIAELDPSDPLLDKVIEEISERNKSAGSDDPKSLSANGEPPFLEAANGLATTTST